jgi:leader peptidase (prepilin peptidase)/N-methyltransferase
MPYDILNALLHFLVFLLGAGIGSFLNVVIYRLPLDMGVNEPRRSFCPSCKKQIPWYRNIPLFSWLALRGKCADCGSVISVRYFLVELLVKLLQGKLPRRLSLHQIHVLAGQPLLKLP